MEVPGRPGFFLGREGDRGTTVSSGGETVVRNIMYKRTNI